jgi:haloalkane dehalogenase
MDRTNPQRRNTIMRIELTPDPELYPFTSHWFDSSRGRVHYVDEGSGPVILLCHGNPTWSFLYRDIIRGLRDHFRCIAPDYLGFGLSDRPPGFDYRIEEHATVVGELVDQAQDPATKIFSKVMGSRTMQRAILQRNFFVERLIPAGTATSLSEAVMAHYRGVQPSPEARTGVARMPKEILAARGRFSSGWPATCPPSSEPGPLYSFGA